MSIEALLIIGICFLSLIILFMTRPKILEYIIKEVRDICKDFKGFIKLVQLTFVFSCWLIFISAFGYFLIFNQDEKIPIFNLFLTIVVGFLGTMIGLYFSKETLEELKYKKELLKERKTLLNLRNRLIKDKELLIKLKEEK